MDMTAIHPIARGRTRLSALTRLTMAALTGLAGMLVYSQAMLLGGFDVTQTILAMVLLGVVGLMATGWRWVPLVGALLSVLLVSANGDVVIHDLMHPEALHVFVVLLSIVAIALIATVAGISATVQNYRSGERRTPRLMVPALVALAALCLGAFLVGALPREAVVGVNPRILAGLPPLTTPGFSFEQTELTAKANTITALRFDNTHGVPHSFDVDELNVHIPVGPNAESLILFTPTTPGTYTFYCGIAGHRELGMEGTLIVEP